MEEKGWPGEDNLKATMFCGNCGSAIKKNDRFCGNCGTDVTDAYRKNAPEKNFGRYETQGKGVLSHKKIILAGVFLIVMIFCFVKAPSWNYIYGVKSGNIEYYPAVTMGEAFENWFGSPKWSYNSKTKLVVFTGQCTYDGKPATATITFRVYENDSFELDSISVEDKYNAKYLTMEECLDFYITVFDEAYVVKGLEPPTELKDTRNAAYFLDWIFN